MIDLIKYFVIIEKLFCLIEKNKYIFDVDKRLIKL